MLPTYGVDMNIPVPLPEKLTTDQIYRFWNRVDRKGRDECWLWKRCHSELVGPRRRARPAFTINYVTYPAYRISYFLSTGKDPGELFVLHSCDIAYCVNPFHLRAGTHEDNMQDAAERGRMKGQPKGSNPLWDSDIAEIQRRAAQGETYVSIGLSFNRSGNTISEIVKGRRYR